MKLWGKSAVECGPVHLIGIGGIGMCGLAEVLALWGVDVRGSDAGGKGDMARLAELGVKAFVGHKAEQLGEDVKLVVVSTAVPADNVELVAAKKRGVKVVHRADVLAEIMGNYSTIAVSGTHGKTSTTALIYTALKAAGVKVGIINGGVLEEVGSTVVLPPKAGDWLVVEADESDASFLKMSPEVVVITNIEAEHMDTYGGSEEKLVQAFVQFAEKAEVAVVCVDSPNAAIVAARADTEVLTYSLEEGADVVCSQYAPQGRGMAFDAQVRGAVLEDVVVAMPGVHFVANSLAALAVASVLKVDLLKAAEGLEEYRGVGRRFSKVGVFHGADIIDDHGHHPTEIATTLEAARGIYSGTLVAVIQPHRFSRLRDLMEEFAGCAKVADVCIVMPVYAAGESPIDGVTHEVLGQKMDAMGMPEEVMVVADEHGLMKALHHVEWTGKGDVIMCMGAGTITDYARRLGEHHH